MDRNWAERLSAARDQLSRRELDLIDAVAARPHEAAFLKLSELCTFAGVSKPVVISCYRALGYADYQEFLEGVQGFYAGQIDAARASSVALRQVTSLSDLVTQALDVERAALDTLQKHLNSAAFEALARALLAAGTTYLYAEGTGFLPAQYLAQRLRRAGLRALLVGGDRIHALDDLGPLGSGDAFIVFNYTQDQGWIGELLTLVRRRGGVTVLVTGTPNPELYDLAVHHLFVPRGQWTFKNSMAVPLAFAHLVLLAVEWLGGEGIQTTLKNLESTRQGVGSRRTQEGS